MYGLGDGSQDSILPDGPEGNTQNPYPPWGDWGQPESPVPDGAVPPRPPFFEGMSLANRVCSIARSVNALLGSRHGMGEVRVIPQAERVDALVVDVAMAAAGVGEDDAIAARTIRHSGGVYFIGFLHLKVLCNTRRLTPSYRRHGPA